MTRFLTPGSRLVLALDVKDRAAAERLVSQTDGIVGVYKIGLELALGGGGIELARELSQAGRTVFLDAKILDIANTVAGAVRAAGTLGVRLVTVHAYPQAIAAAVAARPPGLSIVAVTVLTSLDNQDLAEAGYATTTDALVARRIASAAANGADAVVCSPREAALARESGLAVITPGVRMPEDGADDQKRVATPQAAISAGADAIVVGRPISGAADPAAAARRYVAAIAAGLSARRR